MSLSQRAPAPAPPRPSTAAVMVGVLRTARPKQWVKNVLVLAAPAAGGVLFEPVVLARAALAFACFCLVAGGTYLLNDALDAEADRQHPRKRHRPIAAGIVPVALGKAAAVVFLLAGIALAALLADWRLALVYVVYVVVMQGYSLGLKHVAVIELAIVSSGFVLRAIAGGVAANVEISSWFLIVTSFAALFIVAGKRHAEVMTLGLGAADHRESLREYPEGFVEYVGAVSAAVAIMAYCLWSLIEADVGKIWFELSIVPFVLAILRYGLVAARGEAGAPEDVFAHDRTLQILGLLWLLFFGVGTYVS